MMYMFRVPYFMAVVPMAALLTASFFVLFTLRKIEEKWLKSFGYVVAGFLWLATLVVFSGAVYKITQGAAIMRGLMGPQMKMDYRPPMMQKYNPPTMVVPEKGPLAKDQMRPGCSKCQANKGVIFKAE
jgi:hypothetical protein